MYGRTRAGLTRITSRTALILATTGALLISGCSLLGGSGGGGEGRVRITDTGFATEVSGMRVTGDAEVAAPGTHLTVTTAPAPPVPQAATGSAVLDIVFDSPPAKPFSVDWAIPTGLNAGSVAFVASPGPDAAWTGTPVTLAEGRVSAPMPHPGRAWFVDGSDLRQGFDSGLGGFRTREYAGTADCATSVRVGYSDFNVTNAPEAPLQICLRTENDELVVGLTSRSPHVFTIVPAPGARLDPVAPTGPLHTLLRATAEVQPSVESRGVLAPGESLTLRTATGTKDLDLFTADADPGLSLIPAAWAGVDGALGAWGGSIPESVATNSDLPVCLSEAAKDAASEHVGHEEPSARAIGCLTAAIRADPATNLPAALLESLTPGLRESLAAYAGTVRDTAALHLNATRRVASVDDLTQYRLEATGLGPIRIGMSKSEIFANGWGREFPECNTWGASARIERQNVFLGPYPRGLNEIVVRNPRIRTASGATVGMTVAQLRTIYGDRLRSDVRPTSGGQTPIYSVRSGANEIIFWIDSQQPTKVASLIARPYEPGLFGGC